jgi:selenocysteine lyase/cysteine desulfurase
MFDLIEYLDNLELVTDNSPEQYAGIVTFRHRSIPAEKLYRQLMDQRVLCAQRGGGIRFSPHFYTPWTKIQQALQLANAN